MATSTLESTLSSSQGQNLADSGVLHFPADPLLPGKCFEPRQSNPTNDYTPNPIESVPLSPARKALVDNTISLYEMGATVDRVKRYTPGSVQR
jgi:hypothetical protein